MVQFDDDDDEGQAGAGRQSDTDSQSDNDDRLHSLAFFAPGSSRTLDWASIDDPASALKSLTDGAQTASTSHAPAPEATPSQVNHRGLMVVNQVEDEDDAVKRKLYVLPNGDHRGVYYGNWDDDGIRSHAEGVPSVAGKPTCKKAKTIASAIAFCDKYECPPIFRGPIEYHAPDGLTYHAIGDDLSRPARLVVPDGGADDSDGGVDDSDEATDSDGEEPTLRDGDTSADDAEAEPAAAAEAVAPTVLAHAPSAQSPAAVHARATVRPRQAPWIPSGLRSSRHATHLKLQGKLAEAYRLSTLEQVACLPGRLLAPAAFTDRSSGHILVAGSAALVAEFVRRELLIDAHTVAHATASHRLRSVLAEVRDIFDELLSLSTADDGTLDERIADLSRIVEADFSAARSTARASPSARLLGITVRSTTYDHVVGTVRAVSWLLIQAAVVGSAAILAPRLWHDPGALRTTAAPVGAILLAGIGAALLPLALALCAILTVSFLSRRLWQAKHRIGAPRHPPRAPPPRRHSYTPPIGRPPGQPGTAARPLDALRSSSRRDHVLLLRAAMATAVTAELAPVTVVHRALLALITAFFVLGAVAIGSTGPPPSSVCDAVALAAMPATWRLPLPWLRCSARGLATRAYFAAGGLARRLRIYLFQPSTPSSARHPAALCFLSYGIAISGHLT